MMEAGKLICRSN